MDDTRKDAIYRRTEKSERLKNKLETKTREAIRNSVQDKRNFVRYLCYSDYHPELVNVMDVHLLNAKYEFDDKLNFILGIAQIFFYARNRVRRSKSILRGLTRRVSEQPGMLKVLFYHLVFRFALSCTQDYLTQDIEKQILDKYDLDSPEMRAAYEFMTQNNKLSASSSADVSAKVQQPVKV